MLAVFLTREFIFQIDTVLNCVWLKKELRNILTSRFCVLPLMSIAPYSWSFSFPFLSWKNFFEVLNILVHHREEIPLVRNIASGVKHHAVDSQRFQSVNSL